MPLADARALVPGIAVVPGDPAADAGALAGLADWCGRYSPWTACDAAAGAGGGGLWLDVSGCAHLFGGEAALLADLAARLEGLGYTARAALADGPGAAWALARFACPDARRPWRVVAPGKARAALSGLPVAALRLPAETASALERLGLETVGDLEAAPRSSLAARFGDALVTRLDQAMGRRPEPISPRRPAAAVQARAVFAEPIGRLDDVRRAARRLVEKVCADLGRRRRGARGLALALYRVDGKAATVAVGTARPVRDPRHLERLLAERLDGLDFGFGADAMALSVTRAQPLAAEQLSLAMPGPPPTVMPGPRIKSGGVPGTHVPPPTRPLPAHTAMPQDVDGRDKPGHDELGVRGPGDGDPGAGPSLGSRFRGNDGVGGGPAGAGGRSGAGMTCGRTRPLPVMPGLVPGISCSQIRPSWSNHVDARNKSGHDELGVAGAGVQSLPRTRSGDGDPGGEGDGDAAVDRLADRLGSRLGAGNVVRFAPRASFLPERAVAARAPGEPVTGAVGIPWLRGRKRPLCLFLRPEPIAAMAPVPDGPPVLFRWRRRLHRVAWAEGPERLGAEWWREDLPAPPGAARTRDYFRVEDGDGRRFWLYRNGLYRAAAAAPVLAADDGEAEPERPHRRARPRPGAPPAAPPPAAEGVPAEAAPAWFVHGIFA